MLVATPKVMCTAKQDPRQWQMGGNAGVSYKVTIADGKSSLDLPVKDAEVWSKFQPFGMFLVTLEVTQTATNDGRITTRTRVYDCTPDQGGK